MWPDTIELFYDEAKAQADGLFDTVKSYRSSATAVLAFATGAATFFGLAESNKGWLYVAALVAYGIAVLQAVLIYRPLDWRQAPVAGIEQALANPAVVLTVDQARYDVARSNVARFDANRVLVGKVANRFTALLAATAAVIVLAGLNSAVEKPDAPDKPTRIIIEESP